MIRFCGTTARCCWRRSSRCTDWLVQHYPRIGERFTVESMRELRIELARQHEDLRYHMTALRKRSLQLAAATAGYDDSLVEPAF